MLKRSLILFSMSVIVATQLVHATDIELEKREHLENLSRVQLEKTLGQFNLGILYQDFLQKDALLRELLKEP